MFRDEGHQPRVGERFGDVREIEMQLVELPKFDARRAIDRAAASAVGSGVVGDSLPVDALAELFTDGHRGGVGAADDDSEGSGHQSARSGWAEPPTASRAFVAVRPSSSRRLSR